MVPSFLIGCWQVSVVPSYFSMVKFFRLEGRVASMMLGTKRFLNCRNCFPKVLRDGGLVFECILKFVALGKLMVVDSTSPPLDGLASGFHDLWHSHRCAFSRWKEMSSSTWCLCIFETRACNLRMIEDKLVWSFTWISSFYWLLHCCCIRSNSNYCHNFLGSTYNLLGPHDGHQNIPVTNGPNTSSSKGSPAMLKGLFDGNLSLCA